MAKVRFKWNIAGFRAARTDPKVSAALTRAAEAAADASGIGYVPKPAEITGGRGRARSAVVTGTRAAMRDNAKNHTLLGDGVSAAKNAVR